MVQAELWQPGSRQPGEAHCWRPRRSGFGELVQWDTSEHDWLEGRGPVRQLVRLIDDATSWSWGRFVERDATPFNMAVLWEYLEKNGRMADVYTDRDAMFTVASRPHESAEQRRQADRLTQIGRALRELGIGSILALSPQANPLVDAGRERLCNRPGHAAPIDFQFFTRCSAVRQHSACTVRVGLCAPLVPITDAPRIPRLGTSCEKPQRFTTFVAALSPMRVPP